MHAAYAVTELVSPGSRRRTTKKKAPVLPGLAASLLRDSSDRFCSSFVNDVLNQWPRSLWHIRESNSLLELIPTHGPAQDTDALVCKRRRRGRALKIEFDGGVVLENRQHIGPSFHAIRARRQLEVTWNHHLKSRSHHHRLLPLWQAIRHKPASDPEECSYSTLAQAGCQDVAYQALHYGCCNFLNKSTRRAR